MFWKKKKKHVCSLYRYRTQSPETETKARSGDWCMDGRQMGCCSIYFFFFYLDVFSFVCSFSTYKMDCYGYLTVCPSHFSPHLSSCELLRSPFVYFLTGFHCFSMYLISLSLFTAYQCFCHVHQAGGLDCTEQKNKRHWG